MLVIRRHPGESILIGEDIELEIIECGHNRVKLGTIVVVLAPSHWTFNSPRRPDAPNA